MNLPATRLPTTYSPMLASIDAHLPAIARDSEAFNKSSSQFKAPTHAMVVNWLHALADRFQTAPTDYAAQRGMATFDPSTIIELESHND